MLGESSGSTNCAAIQNTKYRTTTAVTLSASDSAIVRDLARVIAMASLVIANSTSARRAMRLTLIAALTAGVAGHASMIMPPSRNAIDSELPPWSHGQHPETGMIEPYAVQCCAILRYVRAIL